MPLYNGAPNGHYIEAPLGHYIEVQVRMILYIDYPAIDILDMLSINPAVVQL